jgi:hypothetical protein
MSFSPSDSIAYQPDRPGCVTAYAILLWLGAVFFACGVFGSLSDPTVPSGAGIYGGLLMVAQIVAGFGLWRMRRWGWGLVVVGQSLGLLILLLNFIGTLTLVSEFGEGMGWAVGALAGSIVSGGILSWFIKNRHLFTGVKTRRPVLDSDGQPVIGADGQPLYEWAPASRSNTATIIIVGVVVAVVLLPVILIAVLTLLGPQIGEVFSRIVTELSAP